MYGLTWGIVVGVLAAAARGLAGRLCKKETGPLQSRVLPPLWTGAGCRGDAGKHRRGMGRLWLEPFLRPAAVVGRSWLVTGMLTVSLTGTVVVGPAAAGAGEVAAAASQNQTEPAAVLAAVWEDNREWMKLFLAADLSQGSVQALYAIPVWTQNLLLAAAQNNDLTRLEDLADLYLVAYDFLRADSAEALFACYGFLPDDSRTDNWSGHFDEKWFLDQNNNRYFMLADGSIYQALRDNLDLTQPDDNVYIGAVPSVFYDHLDWLTHPWSELDDEARCWRLDENKDRGRWLTNNQEELLSVSQFLFSVSTLLEALAALPESVRTPVMNEFVDRYAPVLTNHCERIVLGPRVYYPGWYSAVGVESRGNMLDIVTARLDHTLQLAQDLPAYYDAVQASEMWVLGMAVNLLGANRWDGLRVPLSDERAWQLTLFGQVGAELLASRLTTTKLSVPVNLRRMFGAKSVEGCVFDAGVWSVHPDYAYAGYSINLYPKPRNAKPVKDVGWDSAHFSRLVWVFSSLYRHAALLGTESIDAQVMQRLANQFALKVFSGNLALPRFGNFINGSNGWYRVGYAGRSGFGYAPYDLSVSAIGGGWFFLSEFCPYLEKIEAGVANVLQSTARTLARFRRDNYGAYWWDYRRTYATAFDDQMCLLQFLPLVLVGDTAP